MKLNVLLAKVEHSSSLFKKLITDYIAFFKSQQSQFKGVRKTYTAREGTIDEPSLRGNIQVVTTVGEKLKWLEENSVEHINNVFSVEATNASGTLKAPLKVGGVDFGMLTSLELLRLKSLLQSGEIEQLYSTLPVRSDAEQWEITDDEQYEGRTVYEQPSFSGIKKSILKEAYILPDPNVINLKATEKYAPQIVSKDTVFELGDYTVQHFSGEISHRERADVLKRRSILLEAVIVALKVANDGEVVDSPVTSDKLFKYLHGNID